MKTIHTSSLTEVQAHQIDRLTEDCRIHDQIRLSYPNEETDCSHFLLYDDDDTLVCALALLLFDDTLAECAAFTRPDMRRRGYFKQLLDGAKEFRGDRDLLFSTEESCADAAATLKSLGAELESREYQMKLTLDEETLRALPPIEHPDFTIAAASDANPTDEEAQATVWRLLDGTGSGRGPRTVGHGRITMLSDECACLHHVEISAPLRRHGCGTDFLALLLPRLASTGVRRVILHVSADNEAAVSLYKKAGFHVTDSLSVYLLGCSPPDLG